MTFFRTVLATLLGLTVFSFLFFIGIIAIIGLASSGDELPEVKEGSVLSLKMSGILSERSVDDPLAKAFGNAQSQLSLVNILAAIKGAKNDDRIEGIYINPMFLQAGQSSLLEIRNAVWDFKQSEKFVYAYGEYISESDYMVASTADSLFLNPEGFIEFNGLNASITFFKGLFDKLDIEPEIFRVGDFKSYVEPFIRKSLSDENRLQLSELILSMQTTYLNSISDNTEIPFSELKNISDKMLAKDPIDAEKLGLITREGYEDEIMSVMRMELGLEDTDDINFISAKSYAKSVEREYSSNKIAVIVADGEIVFGSSEDAVGGDQFAKEIRKARENESVKAIVLRINSPGGSLTASEQIWRELSLTKGVKPLIASMSDVAASGGYYIAAPCDTIIAQPNTVTGSIGIFSIMYNFGDFLNNKLGITNDNVKTGEYSDIYTVTRSLSSAERAIFQNQVENGYKTFINRVSEGRDMTEEKVLESASGRVWTGAQALDRGLIDLLGSYEDAIEIAAEKAGLDGDYRVRYYPKQKDVYEQILESLTDMDASVLSAEKNMLTPYMETVKSLQRMQGLQARMPGNLEIN